MFRHLTTRVAGSHFPNSFFFVSRQCLCSRVPPNDGSKRQMTHVDSEGKAKMVDVGHKEITTRTAVATAR